MIINNHGWRIPNFPRIYDHLQPIYLFLKILQIFTFMFLICYYSNFWLNSSRWKMQHESWKNLNLRMVRMMDEWNGFQLGKILMKMRELMEWWLNFLLTWEWSTFTFFPWPMLQWQCEADILINLLHTFKDWISKSKE